jgi:hypothetical protein
MLSFEPPYAVIDGYTLLGDHADPTRWYALPPAPTLAMDAGRPALSILEYLGGGAGSDKLSGALLNLSTTLSIADTTLLALADRLSERLGGAAGITVTPALYDSGTVELIVLGSSSVSTGAPSGGGPSGNGSSGPFDVIFTGPGSPSLGGDNRASFQLLLDERAAQLVDACIDAPELPILVVYRMQLSGLRPSFSINVQADWSKVYHDLEQRAKANVYFVSADVQAMISETLERDNIKIDQTVFGVGPEASAQADKAQKFLVEWVTNRLFTPFVDPAAATANSIGQVIDDTVFSLTRSVLPGLGYKLKYVSTDELRSMSARMDETVAERREIVPQGTVGGILNALRLDEDGAVRATWAALRESLVTKVNIADFPRLEVQVGSEDRFELDGVAEVTVDMARVSDANEISDQQTFTFRDGDDRHSYVVNLLGRAKPSLAHPYRWRAQVAFDPSGPFGPHAPVALDWRTGTTTELIVEPREAYAVPTVTVAAAPTFSWAQFPAVDVDLRYDDAADPDAPTQHDRLLLTAEHPNSTWRYRSVGTSAQLYTHRITYERPLDQGGPVVAPERREIDDILTVPDPMPRKRRLNLFVSLPWDAIVTAFVELQYRDDERGIRSDEQLELSSATPYIRKDIPIAADGPTALSYRLTVLFRDGRLLEGSWRTTDDDRLVLDRTLVDTRAVSVRVLGGPLAARKLMQVLVRLEVTDPISSAVRASTEWVIDSGNEITPPAPWEYLAGDPPARGVRYQAMFIDEQGFPSSTAWATTRSDLLIVSLASRSVSG